MKKVGVLLVDMDGTIADLDADLAHRLKERGYNEWANQVINRRDFEYDIKLDSVAKQIMSLPGFFSSLKPIDGAVQALQQLQEEGWEIFFCTSPLSAYEHCVPEKYKWIELHFGREWTRRIIVTKDKTLVRGDYLIDDRPQITGVAKPIWHHILYDQSYNKNFKIPRIISWKDQNALKSTIIPLQ